METRYLRLAHVMAIHERQFEKFGGSSGVRDAGLIEAALLRPQTGYYSIIGKATAILFCSLTVF